MLASVGPKEARQASEATNAIREAGGDMGVAIQVAGFAGAGSYAAPQSFVEGVQPELWVGAAVLDL